MENTAFQIFWFIINLIEIMGLFLLMFIIIKQNHKIVKMVEAIVNRESIEKQIQDIYTERGMGKFSLK